MSTKPDSQSCHASMSCDEEANPRESGTKVQEFTLFLRKVHHFFLDSSGS